MTQSHDMQRVMLIQPNYAICGKRSWELLPYNLAILSACLKPTYEVSVYDPNFSRADREEIGRQIRDFDPDVIGITSFSTEYVEEVRIHTAIAREACPGAIIILGGALPTVSIERALDDPNVDFCVMGEGEYRLPELLGALKDPSRDLGGVDGIAFRTATKARVNEPSYFIDHLDDVPFPDYSSLDVLQYASFRFQYSPSLVPRQYPFAVTTTSRGCPYQCSFCAGRSVSGSRVRTRSAQNVLREIDWLHEEYGIKEVIFLDDHFLFDKERAIAVMEGLIQRNYGMTWKCANVAIWSLDKEILALQRKSGCYQMTVSIESGDEVVLKEIIRKPVDLKKAASILQEARSMGYELIANFIFGFPGESWGQIRKSIVYAEALEVDMVNFHIATPLPKTRLMEICEREGLLGEDDDTAGYTRGIISTREFTSTELQILRAFEWDRINFSTEERIGAIAKMTGVTRDQVDDWRRSTRRSLGTCA